MRVFFFICCGEKPTVESVVNSLFPLKMRWVLAECDVAVGERMFVHSAKLMLLIL
jgi:hypothetical protein